MFYKQWLLFNNICCVSIAEYIMGIWELICCLASFYLSLIYQTCHFARHWTGLWRYNVKCIHFPLTFSFPSSYLCAKNPVLIKLNLSPTLHLHHESCMWQVIHSPPDWSYFKCMTPELARTLVHSSPTLLNVWLTASPLASNFKIF